jgi:tRNA (cytidine32/uridine32-2'-O)-methyltransferase
MSLSNQVKIILIETTSSGNIGSTLRAMKNMGFNNLCLINPKEINLEEVKALSANAADLIDKIQFFNTLDEALVDSEIVVATSSRQRKVPWPTQSLDDLSPVLIEEIKKNKNISILFGREDRGLTNEELQKSNIHMTIETDKKYPVLNLAMSVQVVCYKLFLDYQKSKRVNKNEYWDVPIAKYEHVTNLIDHFLSISEELEVFNKGNPRQIESRIKRLFRRVGLDDMEVNFLRGFLGAVEKNIHKKK